MLRGTRMRVMVVMPSFAKGQQRNPPAVGRIVVCYEATAPPEMRCGIDEPGEV